MKAQYPLITFLFFGIISFIIFDATYNNAESHTSGAPASRTGSPGDGGATCKNCHAGPNPTTEAGLITSNIPPDGYTPGQTYTITATVARSGHTKFGFEISPQNIAGTKLGTLIVTNTNEMQLVGTGKYVTHKTNGTAGAGSRTWEFDWTAPISGTGDVTFYGAFNITNAAGNSTGDTTVLSTLIVSECAAPAQPGSITGPDVLCSGSGNVNYSVPPVAGATSYTWTFPPGWTMIGPSSESVQVQPSTNSGTISVSVSNACGTSQAITLSVTIDNLSISTAAADVNCHGGSNGTATANAVSGVGPYDYLWSPGGQTTASIVVPAGSYTVTVTDDAGCTASANATINEPTALQLSSSSTSANCGASDGTATVNASGGTPQYSYLWNSVPPQSSQVAVNLPAGVYTVIVTDQNGCTATATETITSVAGPTATAHNVSNVRCFDGTDGEASVTALSGTAPYTYQWIPSGGTDSIAQNLHAGAYSVIVTDANGCSSSASVTITEPSEIVLSVSTVDAACGQSNGSAVVTANGGVGGYSYEWNSVPVQTTPMAVNLPAGSYIITVTDSNGCSASETVGVNNISGPTLQAGTVTDVTCYGGDDGALSVIVSGGTGPYAYDWLPSGGNDTLAKNLHAGAYSVTVTDALGCISVLTGTVAEPDELIAQPGSGFMVCLGESITLGISPVASGGVPTYSYLWSPAGALNNPTDSMPVASPSITTNFLLIVTDNHGCVDSSYTTVVVNPIPVTPQITANTDSLFSSAASGYQWYFDGNLINGATSQIYVPQQTGNYSVVITDANGCTAASSDYFFDASAVGNLMDSGIIKVYPNPSAQTIFIELQNDSEIIISIFNLTGERILVTHGNITSGIFSLDVSALVNGMYVLEISDLSKEKISRKIFIKE